MQLKLQQLAEKYAKRNRGRRVWQGFVRVMASFVVFCTTYALILPAITMEQDVFCGLEEHTHTEACYIQPTRPTELICSPDQLSVHSHADTCYDESGNVTCGQADYIAHTHNGDCLDVAGNLACTFPEAAQHAHDDSCYAPAETAAESHTHIDTCYNKVKGEQTCTEPEQEAHTHGADCYAADSALVCELTETEGHAHSDDCFAWSNEVICGLEETPAAEPELICTAPAAQEHVHGDGCFVTAEEQPLTCQLTENEEHTHSFLCYGEWQLICPTQEHSHELACFSDPEADLETELVWKRTLPEKLTGVYVDDLLAAADSQLDYTESEKNYIVLEDGETMNGYTRYGAWYGDPYGEWDDMFASFVLYYAGADKLEALKDFPLESDTAKWVKKLEEAELFLKVEDGTPEPGDLVFFDNDGDELNTPDHVAIVIEIVDDELDGITRLRVYEGDTENQVQKNKYDLPALDDPEVLAASAIVGYGLLPEVPDYDPAEIVTETTAATEPAETVAASENIYTYSDDSISVEVQLPEDTAVPADAVLKVETIDAGDEGYDTYVVKAEDAVDGTVADIALYDISFYDADDNYIPVDDTAKVSIAFTESPVDPDANIQVLHFADEEAELPEVIGEVSFTEEKLEVAPVEEQPTEQETTPVEDQQTQSTLFPGSVPETSGEEVIVSQTEVTASVEAVEGVVATEEAQPVTETRTVIEFTTSGFSTFAVVQVETGAYRAQIINPNTSAQDVVENKFDTITGYGNNGKQYVIVSADMKYALSSYANIDNDGEDKLRGMEVLDSQGTAVGNSVYVNANKHLLWEFENTGATGLIYIKSVATGEYLQLMRAGVALTTELTEGDPDNRQMIHTFEDDDSHKVGFAVNVEGDFYYLNRDGGGANYHTWTSGFEGSTNNQFYLCEYVETVADMSGTIEFPSVNIPNPNTAYILAGVNYNGQYAPTGEQGEVWTPGNPTILTGVAANDQQIAAVDNVNTTLHHLTGEIATTVEYRDNGVYFLSHSTNSQYLWLFEQTGTEGVYNINLMGTGNYLHLDEDGLYVAQGKQEITVEAVTPDGTPVVQNGVIHLKATFTGDDGTATTYYAFLNGNGYNANNPSDFTAISSYKGRTEAETAREHSSHLVMIPYGQLVDGLEDKAYIISGVNNKTATGGNTEDARITAAMLTPEVDDANTGLPATWNGNGLKSTTNDNLLTVTTGEVTNLPIDADKKPSDYAWAFEDVGYGTYYIRSLVNGQYLNIDQHSLTLSATPQVIEVIVASKSAQAMTVTENVICLRNLENEYVLLYDDRLDNAFTGQLSTPADALEVNRGTELILTEYKATEDSSLLATDLGGKVYFAVAVNNTTGEDNPAWLATAGTKGTLTGENRAVDLANGMTLTGNAGDRNNNLGWYFEQTEQPGVYYLVAANHGSTNEGKYLKISAGNNNEGTLTMVNTKNEASRIEAVKADTSTVAANAMQRVTQNVICLRTTINGDYWYVNLDGNSNSSNFQSYKNAADAVKDGGNHFVLMEIKAVNDVVAKINTLLDNMILEDDGDWVFSDAAYAGSALPGNVNANNNGRDGYGQQGRYGESHDETFMDDYDQAQKYRREMQLLAREIRTLYSQLSAEDQRYVWRYQIVDSSAEDGYQESNKDLKWLWDVVQVVEPDNPTGVKVNLFNYDSSVNDSYLADQLNGTNNGFTFYHKVQYDEYTQVDTGRDSSRNNGTLGSDDSELTMYDHLVNGYPSISGGRNYNGTISEENGSLAYLFTPENQYWEATMDDGGGLFQRDADGYYYYYANQNAAWYDLAKNQFVLYDTVIRPMYNHGTQPNKPDDVYNFLPFNNPYDDLVFDEYNSIPSNEIGTQYTNHKGDVYQGVADSAANTQKSGYLNERSDMWFGMTIEFDFLMSDDGQLAYYDDNGNLVKTEDMIFDFYGDDDVWVYVDDRLVLDIGGVHEAQSGSINFHTGVVTYQDGSDQGKTAPDTITKTIAEIFADKPAILADTNNDGTMDTFADYTPHTLKFFYMERGGNVSYSGLKFNMPILPVNYLMIDKELAEPSDGSDDIIGDQYYTFRVIQADANGNPLTDENGKYMSFFDEYTPFNVYRGGNPTGNFGLVNDEGYFSIQAGSQAVFENVLQHRADDNVSNYIVMEVFFDEDEGQYKEIIYKIETVGETNPKPEVSDKPNFDLNLDFIDQIFGEAKIGSVTQTTGVDASLSQTVKFTNVLNPPLGKLAITKEFGIGVDANLLKDTEFTIKVEFGDYAIMESDTSTATARAAVREIVYSPVNQGTPYVLKKADGSEVEMTVTSTDGTIKLKAGETATFTGMVAGTFYRVSEQLGADEKWTPIYSGTVAQLDQNGEVVGGTEETITFTGGNANGQFGYGDFVTAKVENTNYNVSAEIPLRKTVENAAVTDNFTFLVQWVQNVYTIDAVNELIANTEIADKDKYYDLPGTAITITPDNATNTGEIIIGFSETSLNGIAGATGKAYYKISEQPGNGSYIYDPTYYIVEVTLTKPTTALPDGKAEITGVWKNGTEPYAIPIPDNDETDADETANHLAFVNQRTTSVVIDKQVVGGSRADEFEYSYTVKDPDTNEVIKSGTFNLNHNENYTITGIPIGAIVEVTEKDREDYQESYNVVAVYEAEYGVRSGAGVDSGDSAASASGHGFVWGIKGNTSTVTIPVYTNQDASDVHYYFRYGQQANRSFAVTANGEYKVYGFNSTGGWYRWTENTDALEGHDLSAGTTDLVIGGAVDGETQSDAPNLDYLKVDFGTIIGNTAAVKVMGDGSKIHFVNEPRTTVTVHKTVEGTDKTGKFTFEYTITPPDGEPYTGTLELGHNQFGTISDIPLGSLITLTETDGQKMGTTMNLSTRIEAEDGVTSGAVAINSSSATSGDKWVGNIHVNRTLTFNDVKNYGEVSPALNFRYLQAAARQYTITVNGTPYVIENVFENLGNWHVWDSTDNPPKTASINIPLAETNTIVLSGVDGQNNGDAPNLDYIDLVWPEVKDTTITQYVNGATTIEVLNVTGYELPETGGTGTYLYTIGGLMLMISAFGILLYYHTKRGKEDYASS